MNKINFPLRVALATVLVATACLSNLPILTSEPATATPDLALTGQIQTLTAAPTSTSTETPILATATATITLTPFPSITPLPSETPTATFTPFGYVAPVTPLPSAAPSTTVLPSDEPPDPDEGWTSPEGSEYRCKITTKTPSDWAIVPPRSIYKITWTVLNVGRKKWDSGVKLVLVDGDRMTADRVSSLRKDVKFLEDITLVNTIFTPKEPGRYRTVWGLKVVKTDRLFCMFTVKITIP